MSPRRILFALTLAAVLPLLAGCIGFAGSRQLTGSGMDMFAPVAMRVHPLTRILPNTAVGPVEVHIEFTDQFGDVTKGVGHLTFHLAHTGISGLLHQNVPLQNPTADLTSPHDNAAAWDAITRTYTFKLQPNDHTVFSPGESCLITAKITFDNNTTLTSGMNVTVSK